MRHLISSKIFLIILFWVLAFELFAKEEEEIKQVPAPAPVQPQPPTRPILPPQVPPSIPAVSPTPSPHIATPLTDAELMMRQTMPNIPKLPNLPSQLPIGKFSPTQPQIPTRPIFPTQIPQIPTVPEIPTVPLLSNIGHVIGTLLLIDYDEAGNPFIEIEDKWAKIAHKIKINPNSIKVVKSKEVIKLSDVEIGDKLKILYMKQPGEKLAISITVLAPEEIELMNQIQSETIAKPEELKKQEETPESP